MSVRQAAASIAADVGVQPASPADTELLRALLPAWDEALGDLYASCDGSAHVDVLPPADYLLSAAEVAAVWQRRVRTHEELFSAAELDIVDAEPAGTHAGAWSRLFIPLTDDGAGDCWALDLRTGRNRGKVVRWWNDSGGFLPGAPTHDSLEALLGQSRARN